MNIKKNTNQLIIAAIIGIGVFIVLFQAFSSMQNQITELKKAKTTVPVVQQKSNNYVVVKADLQKGDAITAQNIEVRALPVPITDGFQDPKEVLGLVLIKEIKTDTPLSKDYFSQDDLIQEFEPAKGFRAVMLQIPSKIYVPPVKPMTFIDIYSQKGGLKIENARILGIRNDTKAGKVVILEIRDDNVAEVIKVSNENDDRLVLVFKNQNDNKTYRFSYSPALNFGDYPTGPGSLSDIAPPSVPAQVTNYNIEEFVINEGGRKKETVEVIKGTEKTECGF